MSVERGKRPCADFRYWKKKIVVLEHVCCHREQTKDFDFPNPTKLALEVSSDEGKTLRSAAIVLQYM